MKQQINHLLANLVVEYHKLQNYHWNIKGNDFFQVHLQLEEYYEEIQAMIDEVAESMLMEGYIPLGSLKEFIEYSSIQEAESKFFHSNYIFQEILNDFHLILDQVLEVQKKADENKSILLSMSMERYIEYLKKAIWMMNQRKSFELS